MCDEAIKQNKLAFKYIDITKFQFKFNDSNICMKSISKPIYKHNMLENRLEIYTKYDDIQKFVFDQIKELYGEILHNKCLEIFNLNLTEKDILDDKNFLNGIYIIFVNNKYEINKKTTIFKKRWLGGVDESISEKIAIYGFVDQIS